MGGPSDALHDVAMHICNFKWCLDRSCTIEALHIPGRLNTQGNTLSRSRQHDLPVFIYSEYRFVHILAYHQLLLYVSWRPYAGTKAVDGFNWQGSNPYSFPPFSLIGRVLKKLQKDSITDAVITTLSLLMIKTRDTIQFIIRNILKISRQGKSPLVVSLPVFPANHELSVYIFDCLRVYCSDSSSQVRCSKTVYFLRSTL